MHDRIIPHNSRHAGNAMYNMQNFCPVYHVIWVMQFNGTTGRPSIAPVHRRSGKQIVTVDKLAVQSYTQGNMALFLGLFCFLSSDFELDSDQ